MQITYNILNLPQSVTQSGTTKATYGWFADGTKYSVLDAQGNGYYYIGSLIYSSTAGTTALESTDFSGGRIVMNGSAQTIHYHHKDHLGSIRAVTDTNGTVIEQNAYYPFGGRHTFGQTYAQTSANRYKFNGKELQTTGNLGLLDYGARMYDTKIARWLVQDPLAEKLYSITPYRFSLNNPINITDPYGLDEWRINQAGYVEAIINNDKKDIITILDDTGGSFDSIEFEVGTIKQKSFNKKGENYSYYQIDDPQSAQSAFEFLANNTGVEWSIIKLENMQTSDKRNYLTTGNQFKNEPAITSLLNKQINGSYLWNSYYALEISHNHPSGSIYPSGREANDKDGDIPFAKKVSSLFKNQPVFKVFTKPNRYTTYFPFP